MRRRPIAFTGLALLLLAWGHWAFWYRSRERERVPVADTLPGRLLLGSDLPYRIWIPYPHQNLAELEDALGNVERFARSVASLSGHNMPSMPSFGAARVPPASELALAMDAKGERFIAAARVYPVAGFLARWAGRLADNPLLAGGAAEIDGRPVEVRWVGGTWLVASPGLAPPASADAPEVETPALTWLRLAEPRGRIPAGDFQLRRDGDDLVISGGDPSTVDLLTEVAARPTPVALLAVETSKSEKKKGQEGRGFAARTFALLPGVESIAGLPGALAAHRGPDRWKLPGERVLDVVSDGPPRAKIGRWRVVALEDESLSRGEALVEFSRRLQGAPPLVIGIWADLGETRRLVEQVITALEEVPIVGRREARRWRPVFDVLAPLEDYQRATVLISTDPPALTARLERRAGSEN